MPREVKLATKLKLFFRNKPIAILAIVFTILPIMMVLIFQMTNGVDIPKVDYEKVMEKGILTKGKITERTILTNQTINDVHPSIVTFEYLVGDKKKISRVKTLSVEKLKRLQNSISIDIKYLNDESVIVGLEPFEFPAFILLMFLPFGLLFFGYLVFKVMNELKLYRYGEIKTAKLVAMVADHGLPISGFGKKIKLDYQYKTDNGKVILGSSTTNDYSLLNKLKNDDDIEIFVLPNDQTKSCMIPKLEAIRNNWDLN